MERQTVYRNVNCNPDSGALNCALQVWPTLTGHASVQVPVVMTSPACRSGGVGAIAQLLHEAMQGMQRAFEYITALPLLNRHFVPQE